MLIILILVSLAGWIVGEIRQLRNLRVVAVAVAIVTSFFAGYQGGGALVHGPLRTLRMQRAALLSIDDAIVAKDYERVHRALAAYRQGLQSGKRQEDAADDLVRVLQKRSSRIERRRCKATSAGW